MSRKLCTEYAGGRLAASEVGEFAKASVASSSSSSHPAPDDVVRLARAAKKAGAKPAKNSARSLKRTLASLQDGQSLEPYFANMTVFDNESQSEVVERAAFLPVHESLSHLVESSSESAHTWADLSDSGQRGLHDDLRQWRQRAGCTATDLPIISIGLWGDGAPITRKNSLILFTYKILSGCNRSRVWVFAGASRKLVGRKSYETIWAILRWSFCALLAGSWPTVDHTGAAWDPSDKSRRAHLSGTPFGFRAAAVAKVGDWMWYKQALGLQGWQTWGGGRPSLLLALQVHEGVKQGCTSNSRVAIIVVLHSQPRHRR